MKVPKRCEAVPYRCHCQHALRPCLRCELHPLPEEACAGACLACNASDQLARGLTTVTPARDFRHL